MCFRITTIPPETELASWPPRKQFAYEHWGKLATRIATQHGLKLQDVANALFMFQDLNELYTWHDFSDYAAVFCSLHGSPSAK